MSDKTISQVYSIEPYELIKWKDRLVEHPDRWVEEDMEDGSIRHIPHQGKVIEKGTPVNSKKLNHMDEGIWVNRLHLLTVLNRVNAFENALNGLMHGTISLDTENQFLCDFNSLTGIHVEKGWWDRMRGVVVCVDSE